MCVWCAKTQSFLHEMKCFGWHKIWTVWLCRCQFRFFLAILHNIGCQQWARTNSTDVQWEKNVWCLQKLSSSSCLLHLVSLTRIESNGIKPNRIESNQLDLAAMLSILIAFNCSLCAHNGLWQRSLNSLYTTRSALVTVCSFSSFHFISFRLNVSLSHCCFTSLLFCIELLFRLNNFFTSYFYAHINAIDRLRLLIDAESLC